MQVFWKGLRSQILSCQFKKADSEKLMFHSLKLFPNERNVFFLNGSLINLLYKKDVDIVSISYSNLSLTWQKRGCEKRK